jgi:hypothetical protein
MHGSEWTWLPFAILGMIFWSVRGRRRRGGSFDDGFGGNRPPQHVAKQIEVALADRDALIANLEERVRVLERIATDSSSRLSDEIERLRA